MKQVTSPNPHGTPFLRVLALLAFAIIIAVLSSLGTYWYISNQTAQQNPPQVYQSVPTVVPIVSNPSESPSMSKISNLNFQKYLASHCKKIDLVRGGYFYEMTLDNLPIIYDSTLFKTIQEKGVTGCSFSDGKNNGSTGISASNGTVYLYDKNSVEGGHGGSPFLGSWGNVIENKNNIKLSVYLDGFPEGGDQLIEWLYVALRGEKEMLTTNGSVFANFTTTAIPRNDPRLIILLNKYSSPSDQEPGKKKFDGEMATVNAEIVKRFFNDLSPLENPEKEKLNYVKSLLSSIELK